LVNVQTRLDKDLPPLDIRVLSGRMGWHEEAQGFEISLSKFSLKLFDDFVLKPTDALIRLSNIQEAESASGEIHANLLELEGLGKLMEYLPLDRKFKKQFVEFSPQGRMENLLAKWQGDSEKQLHYTVKGKFDELSLNRVGNLPGFSGLSGEVDGNENRGTLVIKSRNLKVEAPQFLPEALVFGTFSTQASWQSNSKGVEVKLHQLVVANEDVAGTAYGSYQTLSNSPGKINLNVHLSRASVAHARRYIPLFALGEKSQDWIKKALVDGQSYDFNLRMKGDMIDFPFVDNRNGIFKIQARAKDVVLDYAPDWPRIDHGNAELLIQGSELAVTASSAMTKGVHLKKVRVTIPDVLEKNLVLHIQGEADAENSQALEYIHSSPVRGYLGGVTDTLSSNGNGSLSLKLGIPLQGEELVKVDGDYHFIDSEVDFGKSLPALRKVNGDLMFTESGVNTKNIVAQVLGGPAKLTINSSEGGKMNISLTGRANLTEFGKKRPNALSSRLSGEFPWNLDVAVQNKKRKILFTSSLAGLQSDLPAPLAKHANESMPLAFAMNDLDGGRQAWTVQYGSLLNADLLWKLDEGKGLQLSRGIVNFGNVVQKADRNGLWVIGTLPEVSMKGWSGLSDVVASSMDGSGVNIAGADFSIQKLAGYGQLVNDLHIRANTHNDVLTAHLASKELNGQLSWQDSLGQSGDNGRLVVRLKNLDLGLGDNIPNDREQPGTNSLISTSSNPELPAIDLLVDRMSYKGRQWGRLELQAQQNGQDYQLNHFRLVNADGTLDADGKWKMSAGTEETRVNLKFDIGNAGNILARFGFPNSLKNGSGGIDGSFAWPGSPMMYAKANLNGQFSMDTGKGQFLQIDPGAGKLLSILSLQALPKRISLDFEDVFSKGFEFDNIKGAAEVKQGVLFTDNLKIDGSAAKISMVGQVDLNKETQDLRVRVVPAVGNSAALLSWFLATPIVGASVFLANKILNDPLGQLISFEYNISGSWVDPKVEKILKKKPESENN
jgi:uncharacterized protein (TIGR02099 family)